MDKCNHITGCVCKPGWKGVNCTEDINECVEDFDVCGSEKVCKNLEGSFECDCKESLQRNSTSENCEGRIVNYDLKKHNEE